MGVVFRAHDAVLQRDVALKCPWPALAGEPTARQRFAHEAHAAARLAHPNIVPVFEVLEWNGIPWLAMELIEGRPLRALLNERGALPLELILSCAEGIADALRAAHAKRMLHRDLNPNNVLVTPEGWPFLTDFGLARAFAGDEAASADTTASGPLTAAGHVVGTRCYMSPEQVLGRALDARSDLFSFGAVLYEMCTGRRAFPATEPGAEHDAILHGEPAAVATINDQIPADLDRIVRKALAKRPDERYQEASDLRADLVAVRRRVDSGQSPIAQPRPARRRAWPAVIAVLAFGAALVLGTASSVRSPAGAFPLGSSHQLTADPGWESEPAVSPDGGQIAYTSNASGNPDVWVIDANGGTPLRLTDHPGADRSPVWFPDGSSLAFASDRGGRNDIWTLSRLGGSAVLLVPDAAYPALSPDGRRIAFARPDAAGYLRIWVAPVAEASHARALTGPDAGHWDHESPAWSPDGRTLCYADDRNLWLLEVDTGRTRRLTSGNGVDFEPAWSADGRSVVFSSYREGTRALWRVRAAGGAPERLTLGAGPEGEASLSHDGSRLAYSTFLDDLDIVLLDLVTGRRDVIHSLLLESAPALAADASAIVFTSTRRAGRFDLWLQPLSQGRPAGSPRRLTDLQGSINTPALSPDAQWVAFKLEDASQRAEVWTVRTSGGLPQRISDGGGVDLHPAWSPDGASLAYASERGGQSHIWVAIVRDGRRAGSARQLTSGATSDLLPAWSPDGRQVAYLGRQRGQQDVWVAPATGDAPPRCIARGTDPLGRLRWHAPTGWLWFARVIPGANPRLWKLPPRGGDPVEALKPDLFKGATDPGEFDLSADGRLLAFTVEEVRGDIWLIEAERGAY